jgi:hypothetical protein
MTSRFRARPPAFAVALALAAGPAFAQKPNPLRNAYFGETHVHTSWSFDAYIFGNHVTGPADAYKYAKGEPIMHPLGFPIKITTPLDWMGVTDHSEYAGAVRLANDPSSPISKLPIAKDLVVHKPSDIQRIYLWLGVSMIENKPVPALVQPEVAATVWKLNNEAANAANVPGKFTAFCSYEWTSTPRYQNMHRNVFFRDCAKVPSQPYSSLDSQAPEDLWQWMDGQRKQGNELLAISHNANLSNGIMFPIEVDFKGRPIDRAWAETRDRNERLTEIKQIKGQSETHPLLSPTDEFASYELLVFLLGEPQGGIPTIPGSYVRQALKDGIAMQQAKGYNPYKTGVVGGSDSHNTAVPYRQSNFFGAHSHNDAPASVRMSGQLFTGLDPRFLNPAGLTGVWAEENTRASLFDAMQRKETFATSGPHIRIRFFGGYNYGQDTLKQKDWVKAAYANGVPMGGDLPASGRTTPTFVVWAVKDPTSGNLDRIQIVKGWSQSGQSFEKIYDVAWAGNRKPDRYTGKLPPIGSTVDVPKATYTNAIGAVELKAAWTDPDFDPTLDAFYYARALEIPTPRWTTIQAKELGIEPPPNVPETVQERAWSSPIWYTPAANARAAASAGPTVAELTAKGAVALDTAQLQELVVGKNIWVRNNVTDSVFRATFSREGQRLISSVSRGRVPEPGEVGNALETGYLGVPTGYTIKDGRIVTFFGNAPHEMTVYKLGDKHLAARSNEFGFANYEIIPQPFALDPLGPPPQLEPKPAAKPPAQRSQR